MIWQDSILPILNDFFYQHQAIGIFTAGFIAFIESLAIVGSIIPGSIVMTLVGILLGTGIIPIQPTLICIFIGAFLGDCLSYWLGSYFQQSIRQHRWVQPYDHWIHHGEAFIRKHGALSILIGRFFGPMRSMIPMIAGLLNMNIIVFTLAIIPTIALWSIVYLTPGVLLGALSVDMGQVGAVKTISLTIGLSILFALWHAQLSIFSSTYNSIKKQFPSLTLSAKELTHFIKSVWLILITLCLAYASYTQAPWAIKINHQIYHLCLTYSHSLSIAFAQQISALTDHFQYVFLAIQLGIIFHKNKFIKQRNQWILITFSVFALFVALKYGLNMTRPNPDMPLTGFPSGHLLTILLFLCSSTIIETKHEAAGLTMRRLTMLLLILVIYSRTLLQTHWAIDALATTSLILAIWHQFSAWPKPWNTLPRSFLHTWGAALIIMWIAVYATQVWWHHEETPVLPSITIIDHVTQLNTLPASRSSRTGYAIAPINIRWLSSEHDIINTLKAHDWKPIPTSGSLWDRILLLLKSSHYDNFLPLLPPLFNNNAPDLIFGKIINQQEYIIRLWQIAGGMKIYAGTYSQDIYPERFLSSQLFHTNLERFNIAPLANEIKMGKIEPSEPLKTDYGINSFHWDGNILYLSTHDKH